MKDKCLQIFTDILDGSKRLASYAYFLLDNYFTTQYILGDDSYNISIDEFKEWAEYETEKEGNGYYYDAYYTLYDYANDQPPYMVDGLFAELILAYANVYMEVNVDLSNARYKKGDTVTFKEGYRTTSAPIEFIIQDTSGEYWYYVENSYGEFEPLSLEDYED